MSSPMEFGTVFNWDPNPFKDPDKCDNEHWYIIISRTAVIYKDKPVVVANFTTSKGGEFAYKIEVGFHPIIVHETEMNFGDSLVIERLQLRTLGDLCKIHPEKISPSKAAELAYAALRCVSTPPEVKKILRAQFHSVV